MKHAAMPTTTVRPPSLLRCAGRLLKKIAAAYAASSNSPVIPAEDKRLELLRRCALEGLWDWDLCNDKVLYSSRFRELLGYSAEEPLSRAQIAFHPEDPERMRQSMRRLFDD